MLYKLEVVLAIAWQVKVLDKTFHRQVRKDSMENPLFKKEGRDQLDCLLVKVWTLDLELIFSCLKQTFAKLTDRIRYDS